MPYRIINWEKYQGRKSRGHNPWVKLYKSILSSVSFGGLSDKLKWQSILLLLIADDSNGLLDYSDEELAYKLRVKTFDAIPLLGHWLEAVNSDGVPFDASGTPEADQRCARSSTSTSTSDQRKVVNPQTVQKWFREIWKVYPRKVSKQDAMKAFKDIRELDEDLARVIFKAVKAAKETRQWNDDGGKYIPYPATWIRGRKWEDVLAIETKPKPPKHMDEFERDMWFKEQQQRKAVEAKQHSDNGSTGEPGQIDTRGYVDDLAQRKE